MNDVISGWLSAFIPPISASIRPLHLLFSDLVSWIFGLSEGEPNSYHVFFPFKHDCWFFFFTPGTCGSALILIVNHHMT